jgi:hypothetical protein
VSPDAAFLITFPLDIGDPERVALRWRPERHIRSPAIRSEKDTDDMRLSRDWWAVLIAAFAAVLVKLGIIAGVPW